MNKNIVQAELNQIIENAFLISEDIGQEIELIISDGIESPLSSEEAIRLLTKVTKTLKNSDFVSQDSVAAKNLELQVGEFVEKLISERSNSPYVDEDPINESVVNLEEYNGIKPKQVKPVPYFHSRPVKMMSGYVDTRDINLWSDNDRLEIHIAQFIFDNGRNPDSDELLSIMLSTMPLAGISDKNGDQFKIADLARSIAINGVRKPPIIDINGDLLDGNRRIAACNYILHSDEFTTEEKQRARKVFVWQLTQFADEDEKRAVVVSLNFEPDHKLEWPKYIKAKKIFEEWQHILGLESPPPGPQRAAHLKRELSKKYALGPDASHVNRFLRMIDWANDFKEHHIDNNNNNPFEVEHRTEKVFEYFDELSRGKGSGGVAYAINQDDSLKKTVFDLLYDGKFKRWSQIRLLKHFDDEMIEGLRKARETDDLNDAQEIVDMSLTDARNRQRESRVVGANPRIRQFVSWLEALPISAFRDDISDENLDALLRALTLVEKQISEKENE